MGRYKPKGSKRIVSTAVKEVSPVVSMIPTLKTALIPEVQSKTNFERAGGEALLPKVCGKNVAENAVAKNNTALKDEEAERAEKLKNAGLTEEALFNAVAQGLVAMVCNAETGEPICPANSERAKFLQAAIDILGAKKKESVGQKISSIVIKMPNGTVIGIGGYDGEKA
jgi:hypothetical protein